MNECIEKRDVESLKQFFAEKGLRTDEAFVGKVERQVRQRALDISCLPDSTFEQSAKEHFVFVVDLCKQGYITKSLSVTMLQDIFEVSKIERCELLFNIVEENISLLKQPPLGALCQTSVLRMCNDLLKRLSRTVDTSFCGRILFFLSRFLSLAEKSGVNLMGHFNTQNTTQFETNEIQATDLMPTFTVVEEELEMGEIKESKDSAVPVTQDLYIMFWQLQSYFSNPVDCYDKQKWIKFQKNITEVLTTFSNYKLEKNGDDDKHGKHQNKEVIPDAEMYFAKYLTSPKLLQLQFNDSQFRRYFLIQCVIIFQYLLADVKMKQRIFFLSEEQIRFVNDNTEKCYRLMKETHPKGSSFVDSVKAILQREKEWSAWKNAGCLDMETLVDKQPMQLYRKRPRIGFDSNTIDLGSNELNKLWNIEPDLLKACSSTKRKFTPELEKFLRDPLDELDPEQQVEEEYKSINNPSYVWKACRYLLSESSQYFNCTAGSPTTNIKVFLEKTMIDTAKKMTAFKNELVEREEREARKLAEQSMRKKVKTEGSCSPGPDHEISMETRTKLAVLFKEKTDELISCLDPSFKKKEEEDVGQTILALLNRWIGRNENSLRKLRNALLIGELLTAEVVEALKAN
ncbi:unnamed protein product [Auanema sp. JU1783]|nr:unnamed protein product [Auanema sp. JU1783]